MCRPITLDSVKASAEAYAKYYNLHIFVVNRAGIYNFYEKKYMRESDKVITEYDYTDEEDLSDF